MGLFLFGAVSRPIHPWPVPHVLAVRAGPKVPGCDAPTIRDIDVVGIPVAGVTNLIAWHEDPPACDERHPMGKQLHATNHNQPIAVIVDITSPMKTQTPLRPRAVGQQLIDSDCVGERHLHPPGEAPMP